MAKKRINYKRKRLGRTNYKKRLSILKSLKNRLVIRKSLNNITVQIIQYDKNGDKILASSHSSEIKKQGWKFHTGNVPSAYLTGFLLGIKAKNKGLKEAIMDIGFNSSTKGSRIYASLKGVTDAGIKISHSKEILPDDKRIKGEHIKIFFESIKKDTKNTLFNNYKKDNVNVSDIEKEIEDIKNKIEKNVK
tara:strand:- start:3482 stop:4054 length:573 start_codon:yes stop_codon:yes gene_type:complete